MTAIGEMTATRLPSMEVVTKREGTPWGAKELYFFNATGPYHEITPVANCKSGAGGHRKIYFHHRQMIGRVVACDGTALYNCKTHDHVPLVDAPFPIENIDIP